MIPSWMRRPVLHVLLFGVLLAALLLLAHGADVNARNHAGATPLIALASHGSDERGIDPALAKTAAVLIAHGADITATDHAGHNAVHYAVENGHEALTDRLRHPTDRR